jgi:Carboxypeptidase regulatory-like domain/TonB-dependent Receptor Plug Domain
MGKRIACFAFAVFILQTCTFCFGQTTSRVTGVVRDSSGAVISGAQVALTNDETGVSFTTTTTSAGTYVFDAVNPGVYSVKVSAKGFKSLSSSGNVVTIGQPATVNATLAPGAVNESIVVSGTVEQVQTSTSGNIGNLVDNAALQTLPIVTTRGRNPLSLVELEPGVVDGSGFNQGGVNIAGGGVYVNGARDRAWNYTLDGIDINETSAGGSNFSPLRTNPDMLSEFRVITSNATAEYGRNSGAEVEMVTRSGTNQYHGSGYFFYQTPGFNANDPANIEAGLSRPQFIQKIPGFTFGGPIIKNKTFFFVNFQWLRTLSTTITTNTVYTNAARQGTLRYVDQASTICPQLAALGYACANAPAGSPASTVDASGNPLPGVTLDSYDVVSHDPLHLLDPNVQSVLNSMPSPNNFSVGDGVNIAGFTWLGAEHEKQLDYTVRVDHTFNQAHSLFVRWSAGHQNTLGDTVNAGLPIFPGFPNVVDTFRTPKNLAVSWRWVMNPRLLNEFVVGVSRFGFNFANPDPQFRSNPAFNFFAHPLCGYFNNLYCMQVPLQNYVGNARFLTTYQLLDNMSYLHGAHAFKWGLNLRYQRHIDQRGSIGALNAALAINFDPGVNSDFSAFSVPSTGTSSGDIDSGDLDNLEGSINDLVGRVGLIQQGYVAKSPTAWQPAGTLLHADFRLPEYDFYGQDTWRVRPNLVVDLGLRWEIKLSPRVTNPDNMLRPNPPLGWGFSSDNLTWAPGQLYRDAFKNFGPSIGFAWDPGNSGKTSIRGNFRIAYDRINTFSLSSAVFQGMPGITTEITNKSFGTSGGRLSQLTPALLNQLIDPNEVGTPADLRTPPPFSTNTNTAVDPNWTPPQTYMWSFGIQHELPYKMVLESNYVGRKGIHLFGAYDANQVKYRKNGFLQSFKTVAAGGDSPLIDQLLGADPNKPSSETGSQWMRDPNSPWSSDLQAGLIADEAASLAFPVLDNNGVGHNLPAESGLGSTFFYSYPQFAGDFIDGNPGGFIIFDSHDFSTYNALQTQVRRAFANGFTFQASYTWSKSIDTRSFDPTFTQVATASSPFGASSTPFDLDNRRLNYAPSDFDRTHSFQSIWVFELPFGKGKRWGNSWNGFLDRVIGGWEIGGFGIIQSGRPTTIYAPDYSFGNVVRTVASCDGCSPDMFQIHRDPTTGLLTYVTPEQKNKFSTPIFGEFSNVGRNFFRLAGYKNLSMSLAKKFRITEQQEFETRLEVQNVTNSVHYDEPAANRFTRADFGKVDPLTVVDDGRGLSSDPRKMQVSVRYTF